ncbi:bile acid-CoA:amino acid N-acyltransferase isoform X2 [Camelus ferus]|uniref:Large ribosomal subunit protein mL50 n=2 Tax=Camelus TaxID=9836 RepID=A0A8B7KAL5_CAMFR|nr:bile acid-CoA:amino acid N-acyltransferase isoform X2 [Camelus ferus]XP_045371209.1 bile acid-CoA:amino acid N-acyltransferase isoform X2 [Camelus bactrianus]
MAALRLSGVTRRGLTWIVLGAPRREFWSQFRKEKQPVVAETVEEVKKEPILVCPPLRSQTYIPPEDLQSRLESHVKEVFGSSVPCSWQDISLEDVHLKFSFLARVADDLGHAVPNSRLHQMCRNYKASSLILKFFQQLEQRNSYAVPDHPSSNRARNTSRSLCRLTMSQLTATPASALADEPVHIRATGLPPLQMVTLVASLKDEKGNLFQSRAFYRANEAGELDLKQTPALGGDYVGVHPMGPFWSLKPDKGFRRLLKRDVMNSPFWVTLQLYDSLYLQDSAPGEPRASQVVQRWFSSPGVQRVKIHEGRLRGALFLPPGKGPFLGLIDLFGGTGGLVDFRASLLAARGFAVLALAYFAYEDLPQKLQEVDLEYFEEGANLLLAHPKVQGPGIGVVSMSKGAEIGLAMACFLKQVVATVCINGSNAVFECPLRYRDLVIASIPSFPERMDVHPMGAARLRHYRGDPRDELNQQSVLPIEKAQGQILFIIGEDDECYNSKKYAEQALDQLRNHGKSNGRMLLYPKTGHLLEPPYGPLCSASVHPSYGLFRPILWGGEPAAHSAAQVHAWGEIQKFLRQHLVQSRSKF